MISRGGGGGGGIQDHFRKKEDGYLQNSLSVSQ